MKNSNKYIGWCFDKAGNVRYVFTPVNALGKKIKPEIKTHCGALHNGVGCRKLG